METNGATLDLSLIGPDAKQRLIACLGRQTAPRPIWFAPRRASRLPRIALGVGATALFLGLLLGSSMPAGAGGVVLWTMICVPLALGIAAEVRNKLLSRKLPLAEGAYLFATDLIEVRQGRCSLQNLDQLQEVKLAASAPSAGAPQ